MKRTLILVVLILIIIHLFSTPNALIVDNSSSVDTEDQTAFIDMVYVEGGTFTMGNPAGKVGDLEIPVHQVTVSSFYLGKYEVTQKQWVEVMGFNHSKWIGNDLPVTGASSYECLVFCNKLSIKEGLTPCYSGERSMTTCDWTANGYRLPTEAEWEYAAKGGKQSNDYKYSGSNNLDDVAWYKNNSGKITHPVGQKQPNELGIYDMTGNVREWCWDWLDTDYYKKSPADNPKGPKVGYYRVMRGGAWDNKDKNCPVMMRDCLEPDFTYVRVNGFRVCRNK